MIGDVVGSRAYPDQPALFEVLRTAFAGVNGIVEAEQPLEPTIGDEFQGLYRSVAAATCAWWRLRLLLLADGVSLRAGIGWGEVTVAEPGTFRQQSGAAWWRAREALDAVERQASSGRPPTLRTGMAGLVGDAAQAALEAMHATVDELLERLDERSAIITSMTLDGRPQEEIGQRLGISQPAVSARLRSAGLWSLIYAYRRMEQAA